ncbi:TIGR04282 family arsenosugar biosynthesis glycosyltransferase [Streptomonospora salina]|uniref:TIGR04282 family arsenosugar biosynthesis glycosyltransferase n=1 Tax=Streptomonospora salina TaxID=104205 RepID=UPI0035E5FCAB
MLVIAKEPVPGRVKTRLAPACTAQEAADVAAAALADTLDTALAAPVRRRVLVLSGAPGPWLPERGFEVVGQAPGGLDERLAAAFAACSGPTLLIGMDTPQATPAVLGPALAADAWHRADAWFGPAEDGGFWALGMAEPDPRLLRGVPMSTDRTGAIQRERLVRAGLRVGDLPALVDADTPEAAARVARAAPGSRFAAAWRRRGSAGA